MGYSRGWKWYTRYIFSWHWLEANGTVFLRRWIFKQSLNAKLGSTSLTCLFMLRPMIVHFILDVAFSLLFASIISAISQSWGRQALPGLRISECLGNILCFSLPLLLCFILRVKKCANTLIHEVVKWRLVGGLWLLLVSTYVVAVIAMLLLSGASIATRPRK
jgi:hypothetical protein